jgi:hypothetical protein
MSPPLGVSPFAILHHSDAPDPDRSDHWDWFIQFPTHFLAEITRKMQASPAPVSPSPHFLLAFATTTPPEEWCGSTEFLRLPPHRQIYLSYQGVISGNRGSVLQVAQGALQWISFEDFKITFQLQRLHWLQQPQPTHPFLAPAFHFSTPPTYSLEIPTTLLHQPHPHQPHPHQPLPVSSVQPDNLPLWKLNRIDVSPRKENG